MFIRLLLETYPVGRHLSCKRIPQISTLLYPDDTLDEATCRKSESVNSLTKNSQRKNLT